MYRSKFEVIPRIYFTLNILKRWFLIICIIHIVDIIIVYVSLCNTPTLYELQIFILCDFVLCVTFVNSSYKLQM